MPEQEAADPIKGNRVACNRGHVPFLGYSVSATLYVMTIVPVWLCFDVPGYLIFGLHGLIKKHMVRKACFCGNC